MFNVFLHFDSFAYSTHVFFFIKIHPCKDSSKICNFLDFENKFCFTLFVLVAVKVDPV